MDVVSFESTLALAEPPNGLAAPLQALWWARRGNWERAHDIAQDIPTAEGAWIHAHLHRQEGDAGNARYWYRQAGKPVCADTLSSEWLAIATALLSS